jgi:hypothetical protein
MMNNTMIQMLQSLKSNPMQFILQNRFNVPANILNNPEAMLNHLLSTGQISQQRVNMAYQMMNQYK